MKRTLRKLQNLETMAVEIYRVQIPLLKDERERAVMRAAMENETLHRETFLALLSKRGSGPSPLRPAWWLVGRVLGLGAALPGRSWLLKGDIVFETKAVREYTGIATHEGFDPEERAFLARFLEDEKRHVATWRELLAAPR